MKVSFNLNSNNNCNFKGVFKIEDSRLNINGSDYDCYFKKEVEDVLDNVHQKLLTREETDKGNFVEECLDEIDDELFSSLRKTGVETIKYIKGTINELNEIIIMKLFDRE